jgi:hypothetical protein
MSQDPRYLAFERALHGARISAAACELPVYCDGHVPVVDSQWRWVLCDTGLTTLWPKLLAARASLQALLALPPGKIGAKAPRRAGAAVTVAEELIGYLETACWFRAPEDSTVDDAMLAELGALAHAVLAETLDPAADPSIAVQAIARGDAIVELVKEEIARPSTGSPASVVAGVFGIPVDTVGDLTGLDAGGRLRAASGLGVAELEAVSRKILRHLIPEGAAYPPSATEILPGMLVAARPSFAHMAALYGRDAALNADPSRAIEVLKRRRANMPRDWATHRAYINNLARLKAAGDDEEEASLAEAELSWLVTEGPVRQTGWAMLALDGAEGNTAPLLSELQDRLVAADSPLTRMTAAAIEPAWRNSVAHRDVSYDATQHKLVLNGELVEARELQHGRMIGDAVIHGFACGIALACATSPALAKGLNGELPVAQHPHIAQSQLANRLAGQGLVAEKIELQGDVVVMAFDDGNLYDASKAIAEVAAAYRGFEISRLQMRFGNRPPLIVNRRTLAEVARLHRSAGGVMPFYATWPVIATGRVEERIEAASIYAEMAHRAAWAALRVVGPRLGLAMGVEPVGLAAAEKELDEILQALLSVWRLLPGHAPGAQADVPQRIRSAKAALGQPQVLFAAGKRLHEATTREEPPELPWVAPFERAARAA